MCLVWRERPFWLPIQESECKILYIIMYGNAAVFMALFCPYLSHLGALKCSHLHSSPQFREFLQSRHKNARWESSFLLFSLSRTVCVFQLHWTSRIAELTWLHPRPSVYSAGCFYTRCQFEKTAACLFQGNSTAVLYRGGHYYLCSSFLINLILFSTTMFYRPRVMSVVLKSGFVHLLFLHDPLK